MKSPGYCESIPDEYITSCTPEVQSILQTLRNVIRESAPEAREKISYQMPTFDFHGNLVHFAAFKKHIGFYPAFSGIEAFQDELKRQQANRKRRNRLRAEREGSA
ncbi:hypothetical protein PVOR_08675 [Paenibacillus vortex V453]|uniref:YdhG-like domain-containing protein n=1 Tax=Paenibacillus vortex V453 TaxID=715225 RepID=A0A2R9SYB8_9BACL|nr:DUF1801 domain-containing protein [Paenibacillus vortex]AWP29288.1 hypothetical protein B9D94_22915 [Paenibacillus sp. Cedars]EFU42341.1 hypothetical protein PVOR_08675 [Paenibacillus vortex V453]